MRFVRVLSMYAKEFPFPVHPVIVLPTCVVQGRIAIIILSGSMKPISVFRLRSWIFCSSSKSELNLSVILYEICTSGSITGMV